MSSQRKAPFLWAGFVALLVIANLLVAVRHVGRRAGQWYRWVCPETGARLSYNPGIFGSARLIHGNKAPVRGYCWELVEPEPLPLLLPWNWLALLTTPPPPDPEAVLRKVH